MDISDDTPNSAVHPNANGPGTTKHCKWLNCNSDSRYSLRSSMKGITFIHFPRPCVLVCRFKKTHCDVHLGKNSVDEVLATDKDLKSHSIETCPQCSRCQRWINHCKLDGFNILKVSKNSFICSKHFANGIGPSETHPDPIASLSQNTDDIKPPTQNGNHIIKSDLSKETTDFLLAISEDAEFDVCPEVEEQLWDAGELGTINANTILLTLWTYFTRHFGLNTRLDHAKLLFGHVSLDATNKVLHYLAGDDNGGLREGDFPADRCPIATYKAYLEHRPSVTCKPESPFYLQPARDITPNSAVWFTAMALGKNKLSGIFNASLKRCGIIPGPSSNAPNSKLALKGQDDTDGPTLGKRRTSTMRDSKQLNSTALRLRITNLTTGKPTVVESTPSDVKQDCDDPTEETNGSTNTEETKDVEIESAGPVHNYNTRRRGSHIAPVKPEPVSPSPSARKRIRSGSLTATPATKSQVSRKRVKVEFIVDKEDTPVGRNKGSKKQNQEVSNDPDTNKKTTSPSKGSDKHENNGDLDANSNTIQDDEMDPKLQIVLNESMDEDESMTKESNNYTILTGLLKSVANGNSVSADKAASEKALNDVLEEEDDDEDSVTPPMKEYEQEDLEEEDDDENESDDVPQIDVHSVSDNSSKHRSHLHNLKIELRKPKSSTSSKEEVIGAASRSFKLEMKEILGLGMGDVNKCNNPQEVTQLLWDCGALGDHGPWLLVFTVWWMIHHYIGVGSRMNHVKLRWGDIQLVKEKKASNSSPNKKKSKEVSKKIDEEEVVEEKEKKITDEVNEGENKSNMSGEGDEEEKGTKDEAMEDEEDEGDEYLLYRGPPSYISSKTALLCTRVDTKTALNAEGKGPNFVHLYKLYAQRRLSSTLNPDSPFYLQPLQGSAMVHEQKVWFGESPLGKNRIGALMRNIVEKVVKPYLTQSGVALPRPHMLCRSGEDTDSMTANQTTNQKRSHNSSSARKFSVAKALSTLNTKKTGDVGTFRHTGSLPITKQGTGIGALAAVKSGAWKVGTLVKRQLNFDTTENSKVAKLSTGGKMLAPKPPPSGQQMPMIVQVVQVSPTPYQTSNGEEDPDVPQNLSMQPAPPKVIPKATRLPKSVCLPNAPPRTYIIDKPVPQPKPYQLKTLDQVIKESLNYQSEEFDKHIAALWNLHVLGVANPWSLNFSTWFINTLVFGVESRNEHLRLCWGDFVFGTTPEGREFLYFVNTVTGECHYLASKEGAEETVEEQNCPYRSQICALEMYRTMQRHRPLGTLEKNSRFYLQPRQVIQMTGNVPWFTEQGWGKNKLGGLMSDAAQMANLPFSWLRKRRARNYFPGCRGPGGVLMLNDVKNDNKQKDNETNPTFSGSNSDLFSAPVLGQRCGSGAVWIITPSLNSPLDSHPTMSTSWSGYGKSGQSKTVASRPNTGQQQQSYLGAGDENGFAVSDGTATITLEEMEHAAAIDGQPDLEDEFKWNIGSLDLPMSYKHDSDFSTNLTSNNQSERELHSSANQIGAQSHSPLVCELAGEPGEGEELDDYCLEDTSREQTDKQMSDVIDVDTGNHDVSNGDQNQSVQIDAVSPSISQDKCSKKRKNYKPSRFS